MSTISTKRANVPEYLRSSVFFLSLDGSEEEEFTIPTHNYKEDTVIHSADDLRHLLSTVRFWGVDLFPNSIFEFVLFHAPSSRHKHDRVAGILSDFEREYPVLSILETVRETRSEDRIAKAAQLGSYQTMDVLLNHSCKVADETVALAAESGHFECLRRAFDELAAIKRKPFKNIVPWKVAAKGHLECLMFMAEKHVRFDKHVCRVAAGAGHLPCLQFARELRTPWDSSVTRVAAAEGHLNCLTYALDNGCPLHRESILLAMQNDHMDCFLYLLARPAARSPKVCATAAELGKLSYLQLAHTKGCRLTNAVVHMAAMNGYLECVQYAHAQQCPYDVSALITAADRDHWECVIFLLQRDDLTYLLDFCTHALHKDNPTFLQRLVESGVNLVNDLCESAAAEGALKCLQYLHAIDCFNRDAFTCAAAALHGHLACLQFAHEHGCQWSEEDCRSAAEGGQLACLKYLHTHGCPWNEDTCSLAAETGHLDCLVYAHSLGCPWNANVCESAASNNHLHCLQYAHAQRCPWGLETTLAAAREGHLACLRFAHAHGCTWDASVSAAAAWDYRTLRYCVEHGCPLEAPTMHVYNDMSERYAQFYSAESDSSAEDEDTKYDWSQDFQRSDDSRSGYGGPGVRAPINGWWT